MCRFGSWLDTVEKKIRGLEYRSEEKIQYVANKQKEKHGGRW